MNIVRILKRFLIISIATLGIWLLLSFGFIHFFQLKLKQSFKDTKRQELELLVLTAKTDLLIGNFRNARQKLISAQSSHVFVGYKIFDNNNHLLDEDLGQKNNVNIDKIVYFKVPVYFDTEMKSSWGYVEFEVESHVLDGLVEVFKAYSEQMLLVTMLITMAGFVLFFMNINYWVRQYHSFFKKILLDELTDISKLPKFNPWNESLVEMIDLKSERSEYLKEIGILREKELLLTMAKQVAHDIRSPLMALEVAISDSGISSERRSLIENASRRINAISNNLLLQSKSGRASEFNSENINLGRSQTHIKVSEGGFIDPIPSIKKILAEKELIFPEVKFEFTFEVMDSDENAQTVIRAELNDFESMLSNMLNNSVEAKSSTRPLSIKIVLNDYGSKVVMYIRDNGIGISSDTIKKIGTEGFTMGKVGGSGLGIFYAKQRMLNWGGDFEISSNPDIGTMLTLTFKK